MDGRVALITGAGKGIGRGIALAYAEAGADVVVASRTLADVEEVAEAARALGRRATAVACDVTERAQLEALMARTMSEHERLDVLVNNAGGAPHVPFLRTSEQVFEDALRFNLTQAFLLSRLATPHLLASGRGSIVNISSSLGRIVGRGFVAYGTAKAALSHMTRLLAADLAPKVRVNAIAVGSTATSALEIVLDDESMHTEMVRRTPLRRLGDPADIALGALYLASPAASWVTGKVVEIDGGLEEPNLEMGLPDL